MGMIIFFNYRLRFILLVSLAGSGIINSLIRVLAPEGTIARKYLRKGGTIGLQ